MTAPSEEEWIQAPKLRDETVAGLIAFGWAPGSYVGPCSDCKGRLMGAKRSQRCWECAVIAACKQAQTDGRNFSLQPIRVGLDRAIEHLTGLRERLGEPDDSA